MESIGIGIVTCNRPDMFKVCYNSIPEHLRCNLVVCNDGDASAEGFEALDIDVRCDYIASGGTGVAHAKNALLKSLQSKGFEYIFIIEDDMKIINPDIFDAYITAYQKTGIQHFMFGYHGPANKAGISGGDPVPRKIINYGDIEIALNEHCVGAFCFYTKECIDRVGLMDTNFHNAFEHVDHSYQISKEGLCTPYWWWPDLANSCEYIQEQACSEVNSSIRYTDKYQWQLNIQKGYDYFVSKNGVAPFGVDGIRDTDISEVMTILKTIKANHDKNSIRG